MASAKSIFTPNLGRRVGGCGVQDGFCLDRKSLVMRESLEGILNHQFRPRLSAIEALYSQPRPAHSRCPFEIERRKCCNAAVFTVS